MFFKLESSNQVSLPAFALMITLALLPLLDGGFDHNVMYWVLFLLLIVSLITFTTNKINILIDLYHPLFWYVLFFLWCGISIIWSLNPHRTLVEFLQLGIYGLVFMLALTLSEDNVYRVARIIVITGFGIALFGISEYLIISTGRIESTFTNSNPLGTYLLLIFLLLWGYNLKRSNVLLYLPSIIILSALFLSGSRGAFISLALSLPFVLIGARDKRELFSSVLKTIICFVLAVMLTHGIMAVAPYVQGVVSDEGRQFVEHVTRADSFVARSGAGRLEFWKVGARLGASEPILGHGLGTFYTAYFLEYVDGRWFSRFAHNHYIQMMAENGLVGLFLFMGFIFSIFRGAVYKYIQRKDSIYFAGIVAAMVAFLIHIGAEFSFNFPGAAVIFFAAAGVMCRNINWGDMNIRNATMINLSFISNNARKIRNLLTDKYIGYKFVSVMLMFLLILTAWQYTGTIIHERGVSYEDEGELYKAAETYDIANTIYPIDSEVYSYASNAYWQLYKKTENESDTEKFLNKSLSRLEQAVELSPVDSVLQNILADTYKEAGYYDKAEKHFQYAVDYAGFRIEMYLHLALFYLEQDQTQNAKEVLIEGLEIKEDARDSARSSEEAEGVESNIVLMKALLENLKDS
ncbi:O-antigen ligase family protein [Natranaerofaba carboxydovora]|uniref:O-antigen ligase family protein n=1 Tax=Natranaerofaba carboxydovora TaxID=2742683 RepID=UPI001F13A364|nr:O-antigen ligase family protein [Natranaerofaba carboxydovora]UMZ73504.1 O-Antigen ligase [Natranaerofaba carboxydovora]